MAFIACLRGASDRTDAAFEKGVRRALPWPWTQGSMSVRFKGGSIMAKAAIKARARRTPVRKSAARARPKAASAPLRRKHKFVVSHLDPSDFKSDGLRTYAAYRDLGIKDATRGMAVAHVVKFIGPCDPKVVSKMHLHKAEFQMIYVLKGTMVSEFEGEGVHTMKAGDAWLQPQSIKHKVIDYSDDCEVLEIVMPGNFKTVELEK
jgi:mannose-6-phosphate isomerase-like protein (cupin superfamily)